MLFNVMVNFRFVNIFIMLSGPCGYFRRRLPVVSSVNWVSKLESP